MTATAPPEHDPEQHRPDDTTATAPKRTLVDRVKANWKWLVPLALVFAAALAWLAFGYFGIQTLFIDDKVNEAGPVFDSGAAQEPAADTDTAAADTETTEAEPVAPDPSDEAVGDENEEAVEDEDPAAPAAGSADSAAGSADSEPPEVVTVVQGAFIGRSHPAEGTASVLNDGSEQRFLRFEDFSTDNGPDLNVYLTRADADADAGAFGVEGDYVDLGDLKGNIGPQNYEIPADVDLAEFDTVVIWCVRFGVAFGAADLAPPG